MGPRLRYLRRWANRVRGWGRVRLFWMFDGAGRLAGGRQVLGETRNSRVSVWLLMLVLTSFFLWSYWAEVDQMTRAPGTVIASSKTKTVQSFEPGVVQSILVTEGARVSVGQPVLVLERNQTQSAVDEVEAELASLTAARARLVAEVGDGELSFPGLLDKFPDFVQNQESLAKRRRVALEDELRGISASLSSVSDELQLLRPLAARGDVSESEVIRLERQRAELEGRYRNTKNRFYKDAATELERVSSEIATIEQQLNQRQERLDRTTVVAPVNGIVKNLGVNTVGAVVRSGEALMEILPVDDRLVVEAKISPSEIAFVRTGMEAVVKVDAYDYTIFGDLSGTLTYLSADTLVDTSDSGAVPYYRAQITTTGDRFSKQDHPGLEILPGMTATVEIKTGKSTVFSYLTKPLVKTVSESFTDR